MLLGKHVGPNFQLRQPRIRERMAGGCRVGLGLSRLCRTLEPEAECDTDGAPLPSSSRPGRQRQASTGQELARVAVGWATEGTQSEDTAEVRLQTLWPRCGRRETTAAHIPAAGASPGQEAELAVAEGVQGAHKQQEGGEWAAPCQAHSQRASVSGGVGYTVCQALVQSY